MNLYQGGQSKNKNEYMKVIIEEQIFEISKSVLKKWECHFNEILTTINPISITRSNDDSEYFSEIEFEFWRGNSLISCFSVIIFMDNRQIIEIGETEQYLNNEIELSYNECKIYNCSL